MSDSIIQACHLKKSYSNHLVAVNDISFELERGQISTFLGKSGSGKTTVLKMLNHLLPPCSGEVYIDGVKNTDRNLIELRRSIGYVVQKAGLFPHMTLGENISISGILEGWDKKNIHKTITETMEAVSLDPKNFANRYPHEVSGGQAQRASIARALFSRPPIILMDEPFRGLDPITKSELQKEIINLNSRLKTTIVLVTHDLDIALACSHKIIFLSQGKILQIGTPDEFQKSPNTKLIEEFIDAKNNTYT